MCVLGLRLIEERIMSNKFRFTFLPIFPDDGINPYHSETVGSYDLAEAMLDEVARYTLHLHKEDLMIDHSNLGYVEQKDNTGKWVTLED